MKGFKQLHTPAKNEFTGYNLSFMLFDVTFLAMKDVILIWQFEFYSRVMLHEIIS